MSYSNSYNNYPLNPYMEQIWSGNCGYYKIPETQLNPNKSSYYISKKHFKDLKITDYSKINMQNCAFSRLYLVCQDVHIFNCQGIGGNVNESPSAYDCNREFYQLHAKARKDSSAFMPRPIPIKYQLDKGLRPLSHSTRIHGADTAVINNFAFRHLHLDARQIIVTNCVNSGTVICKGQTTLSDCKKLNTIRSSAVSLNITRSSANVVEVEGSLKMRNCVIGTLHAIGSTHIANSSVSEVVINNKPATQFSIYNRGSSSISIYSTDSPPILTLENCCVESVEFRGEEGRVQLLGKTSCPKITNGLPI